MHIPLFLRRNGTLSLFSSLLISFSVWAMPSQVTLIRHGEKPTDKTDPNLSNVGYERANALPNFFETDPLITAPGPVDFIYAMKPKSADGTQRPIETITPTAKALGLTIDEDYTIDDTKALAQEILNSPKLDGKNIIICWEHDHIPKVAAALGATKAPNTWDGSVFDRAWVLQFKENGKVKFTDIGEHVLPGDSPR